MAPSSVPDVDIELAAIKDAGSIGADKVDVVSAAETTISVVSARPSPSSRRIRREWYQYSTLCLCMWLGGWNDASLGPLLATIQNHYNINYTVVSTLFLFKCVGYIVGSFSNLWLTDRLGFGKSLVLGASLQALAYAVQIPAPPFPIMMVMSWLTGLGMAIQHAQANSFIATGKDKEIVHSRMSMLHGFYGLGAVLSPFAATPFSHQRHWSYINIISCGLSIAIAVEMWHVFKGKRQHEILQDNDNLDDLNSLSPASIPYEAAEAGTGSKYKQVFRIRVLHYLAFVIVFYTGLEITMGGWIVTYLVDQRGGGAPTGYVSSGFYGGLMVGRMILPPLSEKIGRRRVVFVYSALAAAFDIIVWQVPSLIGDAIAVSFMGMVLGPIYPLIMSGAGSWFPPNLVVGAIGWIAGFGQVGSATYPFIIGVLANRWGIRILPPVALAMVSGIPALFLLALLDRQKSEESLLPRTDSA